MSHQSLFIFEGLEHLLLTRTQKLCRADAENNLWMPREGLTHISNLSSHTIFVIGQQVAQWHFYVLIFFPTHSDFRLQFDLLFARDVPWKGNWVATSCKTEHCDGQKFSGPQDTFLRVSYHSSKGELKGLHGPLYQNRSDGFLQHFGLQRIKLAK